MPWESFDSRGLSQAGDGSCIPHVIRDLSRAAYSWVFFNDKGEQKYVARGAVWPSLPQTSQAAEQLQLALLPIFVPSFATGPACYSDCTNAVRLHNQSPVQQMSGNNMYGGLRRGALIHMKDNVYAPAVHTPAHRKLEDIDVLPLPERIIGHANWRSDVEAKRAIDLHPRPSDSETRVLKDALDSLQIVARLVAGVLLCFPRAEHQRPPRRERPRKVFDKPTAWHSWDQWLWGHRCSRCLVFYGGSLEERPEVGCQGLPPRVVELLVSAPEHGHKLATTQVGEEELPLFFCMVCGSHTQERIRKLALKCDPVRRSGGARALARLKRGWHPLRDVPVTCAEPEEQVSRSEAKAYVQVSRQQQMSASAAPLPCLATIRERIAARESAIG